MVVEERVVEERPATETVVHDAPRPTNNVVAQRVVYYIGGVIIAILLLRFVFQLLGANQGSPFVDFVYALSAVFVMPFYGIFGEPTFGHSQLETSTLVAILIYALLTVGIAKLFGINRRGYDV